MEGLEAAEITLNQLRESASTLIDADYFRKVYLEHEKTISQNPQRFSTFGDLELEIDGSAFYPSIEPFYGTGDLPFLRVADVDSVINFNNGTTIPRELCDRFPTLKKVERGDIVLTKGGSVARIGLVTQEAAACRDLIFVDSSKLSERDYTFLCFSLQTKFANDLLIRSSSQTAQPHLTLTLVRDIPLFWAGEELREEVLKAVRLSYSYRSQAVNGYAQAETFLLRELGLEGWQPPEPLAYQSTFRQAWGDGRLDAEFFKPRYSALQQKLSQDFDLKTLGELGQVLKGVTASYYDNGTVPIIRSGDLTDISDDERFLRTHPTETVFPLERGDVLISSIGFGSIGKVQVFDKKGTYGTVSEVTVVRQNKINPYYLAFFLRSAFGQMQIEHYITGATGQLHLYPKDVSRIFIPNVSESKQQEYEHLALGAATARRQAKQLLETAKRAVEVAIEDSEEAALALLAAQSGDGSGSE